MSTYSVTLLVDGHRDEVEKLASYLNEPETEWHYGVAIEQVKVARAYACECGRVFQSRSRRTWHRRFEGPLV